MRFFLKKSVLQHTAHWGQSQPQLFGASIWGGFFESLKHAKQDLSIIEFENQVWNSLHKLVVWKGELILIFGSKIHNLWTIFYRRTKISLKIQPEIQKSDLKISGSRKDKNFWIQLFVYIGYFSIPNWPAR